MIIAVYILFATKDAIGAVENSLSKNILSIPQHRPRLHIFTLKKTHNTHQRENKKIRDIYRVLYISFI